MVGCARVCVRACVRAPGSTMLSNLGKRQCTGIVIILCSWRSQQRLGSGLRTRICDGHTLFASSVASGPFNGCHGAGKTSPLTGSK